ncbi:uncharacterized protein LOC128275780 isoform X1 [Anopheles cruzii]|uniref:uncharacterized protein LOC128275780 isoform X1 n=1 Tax=Anopheles cruzii TaxID=68878 RepID=UPI0022EC5929|nr:uncharacterized protein LOC128275780 isoform X1 [Anopheles cruzii]
MAYNSDELCAPSWLDDDFFLKVMREFENDATVRLTAECPLRPGTKAGDHFASVMYRTKAQYRAANGEQKSIDLIVKLKPTVDGLKKELLDDDDFFGREIRMYSDVLPRMGQLLAGIGEDYKYPRLIYSSRKPHTILVLKDISSEGWVTQGLVPTFEELKPTVRNIAKFHVASMALAQSVSHIAPLRGLVLNFANFEEYFCQDPTFAVLNKCTVLDTFRTMKPMTDACFASFIRFVSDTLNLPEFVGPLERFHLQLYYHLKAAYATSSVCANVLIHGDFHFKNLLHLRCADKISDTMFVDYQMCGWASQVVDLVYLTYMIPEQSVKDNHRDEIVYCYHQTFGSILRQLQMGDHVPRLIDLQAELLRVGALELFHYVVFSAFRYIDMSTVDPEAFFLGRIENPAFEMAEFRRTIAKELNRFRHQGVLE